MTAQGILAHDHHLQPEAGRDPPAPRWLWLIAAILPTAAWLLLARRGMVSSLSGAAGLGVLAVFAGMPMAR